MSAEDFYSQLPAFTHFLDVMDTAVYTPVPPDWFVLLTDVRGSTQAIQAGRYKEVNLLGASSIVAVLNVAGDTAIPFVFGGDGATLLVPPSLREAAQQALLATQALARDAFGLELRVGVVAVETAVAAHYPIRIAKFRPSPDYEQAMFSGGGLAYVERLVKDPASGCQLQADPTAQADFSGLECRWQDVPSKYGETVSLLVLAQTGSADEDTAVYRQVFHAIQEIYGDPQAFRTITTDTLQATLGLRDLMGETFVRAQSNWWSRLKYLLRLWAVNLFFRFYLLPFDVETTGGRWSRYIDLVVETSDYRKYDEILRMIIAGTPAQRQELTAFLQEQRRAGKLVYGLHVTDRALLTCLVFERMGRQVHFVDGADGGYALAAKALKQQLEK